LRLRTTWVLGIVFGIAIESSGQVVQPLALHVRGAELHYVEQGTGEPLILLHGGQGDYRSWAPQMAALSPHFRVISYSRRYHYPNHNPLTATNHSAYAEAEDLAAVIRTLGLGPVHLVGTSIGAATALVLALQHPENGPQPGNGRAAHSRVDPRLHRDRGRLPDVHDHHSRTGGARVSGGR
jgi:pimeloyl-ACP methyl ester carboxylesterase